MRAHRLFIHGSGRKGEDAWPQQSARDSEFLSFADSTSIRDQADILAARAPGALVFAHSIGAVPAVIAAKAMDARALVLVEPALYDLARGHAAIERHIGIVTEARAQAEDGNLRGFWAIFRPLMFGAPLDGHVWDTERSTAERWAAINVPWGHAVRPSMMSAIPTLVVTGGWNGEYEIIARTLAGVGASHVELPGAEHRPQDLPAFAAIVDRFERTLST